MLTIVQDFDPKRPVDIYHNRAANGNKMRQWSIRQKGVVVAYADTTVLTDAALVVKTQPVHKMWAARMADQHCPCGCGLTAGARGVKKNVFAWITGYLTEDGPGAAFEGRIRVTFHPDTNDVFEVAETGEPVFEAHRVRFDADRRCWI